MTITILLMYIEDGEKKKSVWWSRVFFHQITFFFHIAAHQSSPQCAHSSVIHGSAVDSRVTVGVTIVGMKLDQLPGALGV